jgi:hypothetical protein
LLQSNIPASATPLFFPKLLAKVKKHTLTSCQ